MRKLLAFALLSAVALTLAGCDMLPFGNDDPPLLPPAPPMMPPQQLPQALPPAPVVPVAPQMPVAAPAVPVAPVAVPPYQWTATPTVETIPLVPVGGMANNAPFAVAQVYLEPGMDSWKLVVSNKALDTPTSILMDAQFVSVNLNGTPAAGITLTKEMNYGDGFFQIAKDAANPAAGKTSWNASNAYVVEFTTWNVAPYDPAGEMFQAAGTASGKLSVCYQGSGSFQNSWVAGTFENAVVRYMGKPSFEPGAAPAAGEAPASNKEKAAKKKKDIPKEEAVTPPKPDPGPKDEAKPEEPKKEEGGGMKIPDVKIPDRYKGKIESLRKKLKPSAGTQ